MIQFGIVGTGWRSLFYLRVARACPERFKVVGVVTRNTPGAAQLAELFDVPLYAEVDKLVRSAGPTFVVTSVPWAVNPGLLRQLAALGVPALSETPPATTLAELVELYSLVEQGAKIQVAEQYWAQPHHAARLAFAHSGKIGRVSQAQVSAAHGYHGISLIRRFLGVGFEDATIAGRSFTTPLMQGPDRKGPPDRETIVDSSQAIATFDFGVRFGVLDFTGDQYFSPIRGQRLLVRGERGELINEQAVYLQDPRTPIRLSFTRHAAGADGNLEGNYLKGIQAGEQWVYHNPLAPGELSDDEIAVGTCLLGMATYVAGGPPFYSLAEACQDRYLDICMQEALATGRPVSSEPQAWTT